LPNKYRASTEQVKALRFCRKPKARSQIQKHLKLKHREHFRAEILGPLIEEGFMRMTLPDKPNSPNQEYVITDKGKRVLKE
jgi:ATP-dependent DNA helicase RecG